MLDGIPPTAGLDIGWNPAIGGQACAVGSAGQKDKIIYCMPDKNDYVMVFIDDCIFMIIGGGHENR